MSLDVLSSDWLLTSLVLTASALAVLGMLRRVQLWRQGQKESVALIAGLKAMPKRYLVDLHHVVARDKAMSHTHVATAGGFVLSVVLIFAVYVFKLAPQVLSWMLLGSLALMLVGAGFVFRRRLNPPSRLSQGSWMRLPRSLIAFAASFFLLTLPLSGLVPAGVGGAVLSVLLLAGIIWGMGELFLGMGWGGPMKHAFAGALHLAFHRRPERFGGGRSTGLKVLDLDAEKLGVEKPSDFKWNQLLGFDACVQCGKCEAMCPAFAAGQPLNPKKLIQDMVVGLAGGSDKHYAGSPYPGKEVGCATGGAHNPIVNGLVQAETLWSCTTCRACVEECPMMIEHVDAIVDMRRFLTLEKGQTPEKGVEVLENLIYTDNPNGYAPQRRSHWAADQDLKLMSDVKRADVLFWVSDGAFDMRSQRILKAFVQILKAAGMDVAILGDEELDCGDVARRLGDDATFQRLAKRNIETLQKYDFNCIVTTDPHAFHVLKNEYPDLYPAQETPRYQVWHHTTFINQLAEKGVIELRPHQGGKVTYHDPCYLGRYNGEYDAPRSLLSQLGIELAEMERSGFRSRCCGGGGAAPITDIPGERRIADMRMDDIRETGAELVAVGCQQCTAMLEGVVEPRPQVKDIAEIVADALVVREAPTKEAVWAPEPVSETV
ncbi:(Fe-S)-binding protein [Vibrio fluvialis]|uniref:(Fe-S)-binding protein n=1 Tax=Vibrio fluvialis TaxID=676 RepID=UPI00111EA035|nr:(Fe-S)-binding protein [Vibrio fluvialis]MBL4238793.1 (Fe-S)-binding protein [Vibrio fluvialis]MBL4265916.1 (Fe-S)-binding protein [Vibrio fluvialis]MBL4270614.1 (Fe-S)-binding protein [Vibrio fluvialis]MBL4274760.1 (Fe-S)-binding protein [Vibrio fluvialis]MBO1442221.1 (Fe-S)-binding protein [Vibrio fluvialis]